MMHGTAPIETVGHLPRSAIGRRLACIRVRMRRRRLDTALAQGADPWTSEELLVRASELTSLKAPEPLATSNGLTSVPCSPPPPKVSV